MEKVELTIEIAKEKLSDGTDIYVAECLGLGICSQGPTVETAKDNIEEAVTLFFETASLSEIDRRMPAPTRRSGIFTTKIEVAVGQTPHLIGV